MMWEVAFGIVIAVLILALWPLWFSLLVILFMIVVGAGYLVMVVVLTIVGVVADLFDRRKDK